MANESVRVQSRSARGVEVDHIHSIQLSARSAFVDYRREYFNLTFSTFNIFINLYLYRARNDDKNT